MEANLWLYSVLVGGGPNAALAQNVATTIKFLNNPNAAMTTSDVASLEGTWRSSEWKTTCVWLDGVVAEKRSRRRARQ